MLIGMSLGFGVSQAWVGHQNVAITMLGIGLAVLYVRVVCNENTN